MSLGSKTKSEINDEKQIKLLTKALKTQGFEVRREKLARGDSFRVKSGNCEFSGQNIIFIDSRLPPKQQFSVLLDYLVDLQFSLSEEELKEFPPATRALLEARSGISAI